MVLHADTGNTAAVLRDMQRPGQPLHAVRTAAWGDALCALAWDDQAAVLEAPWRTLQGAVAPLAVYSLPAEVRDALCAACALCAGLG